MRQPLLIVTILICAACTSTTKSTVPKEPATKSRPVDVSHLMKAPPATAESTNNSPVTASCRFNGKVYQKGEAFYDECLRKAASSDAASTVENSSVRDPENGLSISVDLSK